MYKLSFFFYFLSFISFSQNQEFILFLKDKPFLDQNELFSHFSEKSLLTKLNTGFDYYDVPLNKTYLSELSKKGSVINASKWLNAVHYSTNLSVNELQNQFDFVSRILSLHPAYGNKDHLLSIKTNSSLSDTAIYDNSYDQLEITRTISCLHNKGFDGNGVLIAVLDAGFPKLDSMSAFKKMRQEGRIIDTWDFEDNASNVFHKSTHGTVVSSVIGAQLDSSFIGAAPQADYAFYITEIARFERNIEEFNLVLGLERADSIGADICSISLGYRNFDSLQVSYGYAGMDGKTTIVAQGVSIAKDKGMIISVAAGNSGSGAGTLSSPCDADSILCVGAIKYDSTRAGFSSEGPTFDGRIKPDVVTIGEGCYFVQLDDSIRNGNGTSFATPLMSGMVACLKQAHPLRSNFQLIEAIKTMSHSASTPDNIYGWGIPNACKIDSVLSLLDSVIASTNNLNQNLFINLYPNPTSSILTITTSDLIQTISLFTLEGKILKSTEIQTAKPSYEISVANLPKGIYIVTIKGLNEQFISKKIIKN